MVIGSLEVEVCAEDGVGVVVRAPIRVKPEQRVTKSALMIKIIVRDFGRIRKL